MNKDEPPHSEDPLSSFDIPDAGPIPASGDDKAESEAVAFALDLDLESEKTGRLIGRMKRREKLDEAVNNVLRGSIYFGAILIACCFLVLIWSKIAPCDWIFLSPSRVQDLKDFLLSGALGGALSILWRSQMSDKDS